MIYDYNHYNDPKKATSIYTLLVSVTKAQSIAVLYTQIQKDRLKLYLTHITENGMIMAVYCQTIQRKNVRQRLSGERKRKGGNS